MRKRSRLGARFRAVTVGLATAVAVGMPVIVHAATSDTPGYSTTTIGAFNAPKGIALTPNGKALYVANSGNQTVSVVDTATKHITHTISDPSFSSPTGVAVAPDSAAAYVSNRGSGTV